MELLIQHMTALYHEISDRLLQLRLSRAQAGPSAAEEGRLLEALVERLQGVASSVGVDDRAGATGPSPQFMNPDRVKAPEMPRSRSHTPAAAPPLPPLGERPPSLSREPTTTGLQLPLAAQLQQQTLRYIRQALDFARQGKAEMAQACARYAESTLRLAAQRLSAEDYQGFRDEILARLARSSVVSTPSDPLSEVRLDTGG